LRLLSRVANQGPSHERQAFARTGIGRDAENAGTAVEPATIEHRTEGVPERRRVTDLELVVGCRIHERLHGPGRPRIILAQLRRGDGAQHRALELERIAVHRSLERRSRLDLELQLGRAVLAADLLLYRISRELPGLAAEEERSLR